MLNETLDPAEALGEREQAAALERAARRVQPPAQHRRDDAAEAARHLGPRERVLRVARQPRVIDALHLRLLLEELRDGEREIGRASCREGVESTWDGDGCDATSGE